ncbi:MAG: hypothetical protein DHS20C09_11460 [marine bacterium B5-7]|nr:MAG: hypothetical protein DHS20C09_11460 [marine bacterium B5-7]
MNSNEDKNMPYGVKHWLYQIIPPLLMLCILFATDNGTSLVFLAGVFILPVFISAISIILKLFNLQEKKYYLPRPVLTIVFFILILAISQWSYKIALEHATNAAQLIHNECNSKSYCPENPSGWENDGSRIIKRDLGFWLMYSASYYYNKEDFKIRVYQGPDLGERITGGVNIPFKVERYREK